ncbi:MAG: response regulator transcription factor [Chloroflexi bacterium]|nr:response regulator transcription factor [Chloroflexota bacterium]
MTQRSDNRMASLREQLQHQPGLGEQLPSQEGEIVRAALDGQSVYEIAQQQQVSEGFVWNTLSNAARMASGQQIQPVETGGFGSDTDPGVTGGYGETGFGSLSADSDPGVIDAQGDRLPDLSEERPSEA